MSYSTANTQKFTLIDNLPDLDDLEGYSNNKQDDKYSKFIRQSHSSPQQSGMVSNNINQHMGQSPMGQSPMEQSPMEQYMRHQPSMEQFENKSSHNINSISCLEIAEHVSNCPICSKFYKNDNTIYIIAIVVLLIICILLLKKCLDI